MVARQDALVVRQGDHLNQVSDGRDDRRIELRLGGWWRPFGLASKLKDEA